MTEKMPQPASAREPISGAPARPSVVLRDVVMQGHVALTRPRSRGPNVQPLQARTQATNLVPVRPGRKPEEEGATVAASAFVRANVPAATAQPDEEARRGYEEGLAKGIAEGRARSAEEARQLAVQTAEKAERELREHADRLAQELKQQAQSAYQARVQTLDNLIAAAPPQIESRLAAAQEDMLALCFEVVCRILGERAAMPEAVQAHLEYAVNGLRSRRLVAVHLHPDDLAALQKAQSDVPSARWGGEDVQWIASPDIALGGCVLQSPEGGLDARFETQLNALRDLLLQSRASLRSRNS
ncbi:FliH/SctL family protein [Variovorax sp. AFSI2.2]|uniref:FliH/SctL family protein n=1 Tax=Variovorax sp. AFSI2.2 TaxID=3384160 RepID=UPI003EB8CF30